MVVDEAAFRKEIEERRHEVTINVGWLTPSGRPRSAPMYESTIRNEYLGKERTIKGTSQEDLERKILAQFNTWAEQEVRSKVVSGKKEASARAAQMTEDATSEIEALRNILKATLSVDDQLDWGSLVERKQFPKFEFEKPMRNKPPVRFAPEEPKGSFWEIFLPHLKRKRLDMWQEQKDEHQILVKRDHERWTESMHAWEMEKAAAENDYSARRDEFEKKRQQQIDKVSDFRWRFEAGEAAAIEEYANAVFERSQYPEGFDVSHSTAYDEHSKTLVVNVTLPTQETVPNVIAYKFLASSNQMKATEMKQKEHDSLYDEAIKQTVIRTLHEVFESVYTGHVQSAVVNGWVTYVDGATGNEMTSCVVSVSTTRADFEALNLSGVDATTCIKNMRGLIAGPLAQVAPVKPIMQLSKDDSRFIESQEVLAQLNEKTNLAEIAWEEFEHLVRELFGRMFSEDGSEVRVTQASKDGGVDAIAFDPDPIRGGKFVIQAKRYTNVVGVSAVRDLYGTMINEGAAKGILVTTSRYGPDSREFAKDKPITLIDGPNLVYLLEKYGYKVRIDVKSARENRLA